MDRLGAYENDDGVNEKHEILHANCDSVCDVKNGGDDTTENWTSFSLLLLLLFLYGGMWYPSYHDQPFQVCASWRVNPSGLWIGDSGFKV